MATSLNDLYAALRERIRTVWPEVVPNGIYEADHVESIPWEQLTAPYAVIAVSSMPRDPQWGAANQAYKPLVEIYRVDEVKGPLSNLRNELEALDTDLSLAALTSGQTMRVEDLCWSLELEPNQVFVSKRMPHRAGRLSVTCLIGRVLAR